MWDGRAGNCSPYPDLSGLRVPGKTGHSLKDEGARFLSSMLVAGYRFFKWARQEGGA
jgi:hypothetical protein